MINFVSFNQNRSNTPVTTFAVGYPAAVPGNTIIVGFENQGLIGLTVTDSNSVILTSGPSMNNGLVNYEQLFYYVVPASSPTQFTATWTTASACSMFVAEYSGVSSINQDFVYNVGLGTTQSLSLTTSQDDSFFVAFFATLNQIPTISVGNSRLSLQGSANRGLFGDNEISASGTTTNIATTTGSSIAWSAVGMELLPLSNIFPSDLTSGSNVSWELV